MGGVQTKCIMGNVEAVNMVILLLNIYLSSVRSGGSRGGSQGLRLPHYFGNKAEILKTTKGSNLIFLESRDPPLVHCHMRSFVSQGKEINCKNDVDFFPSTCKRTYPAQPCGLSSDTWPTILCGYYA